MYPLDVFVIGVIILVATTVVVSINDYRQARAQRNRIYEVNRAATRLAEQGVRQALGTDKAGTPPCDCTTCAQEEQDRPASFLVEDTEEFIKNMDRRLNDVMVTQALRRRIDKTMTQGLLTDEDAARILEGR